MKSSKLLVAAAAAISVFGAATYVYAQGSTETGQGQVTMPPAQGQMQQQTTLPNAGATTQPATDGSMNRTDGYGTSGMGNRTTPMATDAKRMRSQSDGSSGTTERVARADRN